MVGYIGYRVGGLLVCIGAAAIASLRVRTHPAFVVLGALFHGGVMLG